MSGIFTRFLLPLCAVGLLVFAVVHVTRAQKPETKSRPMAPPPRNPFPDTVAGAGIVEPETENIAVGTPVAGVVVEVYAKVGQKVQPGSELFRLDDRVLQAELNYRQAATAAAQADLTRLEHQPRPELLSMMKSQLDEAQANLLDQRDQYQRVRELVEKKVSTDAELITRQQAYRAAHAKQTRAETEYAMTKAGAWEYELLVARAAVEQARAQQQQVEMELARLVVRALVSGEVLQVSVRPGEYVATPSTGALVVIGNVDQLHVRVDIDEYDIPRFRPGAPAKAMLKGQSKFEYPLKFVRVEPYVIPKKSLTGDNTERVDTRVLQVIYAIDPAAPAAKGKRLYVGQQVDAYIDGSPDSGA